MQLGQGSFITMGFGNDISVEMIVRHKKEINNRAEWYLWVYMCAWELKTGNQIIACNNDERDIIKKALKYIEKKKLIKAEMLSDNYDMQFEFEDEISLHLSSNLEEDLEQWMLFTPDNKVLTAGPFQELTYESEED